MKGILKDVEIPEMTIPAIIVDFANLNQCLPWKSTVRFHYKYFKRVCKAHTSTDFALFLKEEFLYCCHSFAKRMEAVFLQNKASWQDAFLQKVLADTKEGQRAFALLDLSAVGEQFSQFLPNNLICECDHEEDEVCISTHSYNCHHHHHHHLASTLILTILPLWKWCLKHFHQTVEQVKSEFPYQSGLEINGNPLTNG